MHPSNSSYDADQSRVDDVNSGGKLRQNDVSNSMREVADDVVVQVKYTFFSSTIDLLRKIKSSCN